MRRDLTAGNPLKIILGFCVPILIGNLFQQSYSIVDSMIVSAHLGVNAFAAIGSTASLNFLIIGFAVGLCSGLCIPIAQHYGAGDIQAMRRAEANGIYIAGIAAVLISVLLTLFTRPILIFLKTPEILLDDAGAYIGTLFAGCSGMIVYNMAFGYLRAIGDSRTPLVILMLAAVLNILLDLLFIVAFKWGPAGAAWATNLAQLSAGLVCLFIIRKNFPVLHLYKSHFKPSLGIWGRLAAISIPVGLQSSITAIGSIVLQAEINNLGSQAVTAHTALSKVQAVICAPFEAMGVAVIIFCSQNCGARLFGRIREGLKQITLASFAYALFGFGVMWLVGHHCATLFLGDSEPQVYAMAQQLIRTHSSFFIPLALIYVYRSALQGLGYAQAAMGSGLAEMVARIGVSVLLIPSLAFTGSSFASPAAWTAAALFVLPMYLVAIKSLEKKAPCAGPIA